MFAEHNAAPATAPAAPSNLAATAVSASQVNLTCTDNANNETGFVVQRSADGGKTWVTIATRPADTTAYTDTSVSTGTTYYYRVFAFNDLGDSDFSNVVSVRVRRRR